MEKKIEKNELDIVVTVTVNGDEWKKAQNKEFNKKFSCNIPESYYAKALKYKNTGLIICTDNSIKLTRKGFLVSNELIAEIIL